MKFQADWSEFEWNNRLSNFKKTVRKTFFLEVVASYISNRNVGVQKFFVIVLCQSTLSRIFVFLISSFVMGNGFFCKQL